MKRFKPISDSYSAVEFNFLFRGQWIFHKSCFFGAVKRNGGYSFLKNKYGMLNVDLLEMETRSKIYTKSEWNE